MNKRELEAEVERLKQQIDYMETTMSYDLDKALRQGCECGKASCHKCNEWAGF